MHGYCSTLSEIVLLPSNHQFRVYYKNILNRCLHFVCKQRVFRIFPHFPYNCIYLYIYILHNQYIYWNISKQYCETIYLCIYLWIQSAVMRTIYNVNKYIMYYMQTQLLLSNAINERVFRCEATVIWRWGEMPHVWATPTL